MSAPLTIGVYDDVPAERYHADDLCPEPSLSRSFAHTMISECPLKAWLSSPRLNKNFKPIESTKAMDFGSLGHLLLLGKGAQVDVCSKDDWRTDFAKGFRDDSKANGRIPVLQKTYDEATQMKEGALRELKRLGILPDFEASKYEQTIIFRDDDSYLRARPDAMLVDKGSATINLLDVKCTNSAEPEACIRRIGESGYDLQVYFYSEAAAQLHPDLRGRVKFLFLFIETEWPYLVSPIELNGEFLTIARSKYNRSLHMWKRCLAENRWSGYSKGIVTAAPRPWDLQREMEASNA